MKRFESCGHMLKFLDRYGAWGYVDTPIGSNKRVVILRYRKEKATISLGHLAAACQYGWIDCFPGTSQFKISDYGQHMIRHAVEPKTEAPA